MKTENIANPQRWEDVVFENRNKEYGAYFIRKIYSQHIVIAVVLMLSVIGLVLAFPTISEWIKGQEEVVEAPLKQVKYNELAAPPPLQENTPPPPQLDIPPPVKTIIKFLPPKVTEKEVAEEEEMPTMEEVKQNDVGSENVEGTGEVIFEEPVVEITKEVVDDNVIFTVVEQTAEYPGGMAEMSKFLSKSVKYPAAPRRMGIEGTVFVQFVVDKDGTLTDVQVVKGIHVDCDKEAIRVVKAMPAWKPGKQNGRAVRQRYTLPIRFKLQ